MANNILEDLFSDEKISRIFNIIGPCVDERHYSVNINDKLRQIISLVQADKYFVINRPRQFGKTTTLSKLKKVLKTRYSVVSMDFQFMGTAFKSEERFCEEFTKILSKELEMKYDKVDNLQGLGYLIQSITKSKNIILIIDEIDKVSNNELLIEFLGVLRSLYMQRDVNGETTFKSVILAGVHDVKNLKLKFKDDMDVRYNSPWNIAVDFKISMNFSPNEIKTMLDDYNEYNNKNFDTEKISKEIFKFTNGYPFLVSLICKTIDESVVIKNEEKWMIQSVSRAVKEILLNKNTLFEDLIKNIENNTRLNKLLKDILLRDKKILFDLNNPIIDEANMFGYIMKDENGYVSISNVIFTDLIMNYMVSKMNIDNIDKYSIKSEYLTNEGRLDLNKVILRFQDFIKQGYERGNKIFLEGDGRLNFSAFITPIINGTGFFYREARTGDMRRMDLVIQYGTDKFRIELKRDLGNYNKEKTLEQTYSYLNSETLNEGYIIIFTFGQKQKYEVEQYKGKIIHQYWI